MRAAIFLIVAIACATALPAETPPPDYPPLPEYRVFGSPASEADAQAIEDLMRRLSRAWGHQQLDALIATYHDDAEWTNAFGVVARGHAELRDMFTWLFDRFPPTVTEDEGDDTQDDTEASAAPPAGRLSLRYIGSDAAVIQSATESSWGEGRDGAGLRRVLITYVLERRDGTWRIAHQMIMDARR